MPGRVPIEKPCLIVGTKPDPNRWPTLKYIKDRDGWAHSFDLTDQKTRIGLREYLDYEYEREGGRQFWRKKHIEDQGTTSYLITEEKNDRKEIDANPNKYPVLGDEPEGEHDAPPYVRPERRQAVINYLRNN